ncbi:NlpC/P60 family protein [Hoylesella oralis]|uniref:C40 family peptidase n=1 Tax=Hoylesella oralis TaxID=28134 RepID=UPI00360BCFE8
MIILHKRYCPKRAIFSCIALLLVIGEACASTVQTADSSATDDWAIVNVSVCNLRQAADYDAGQASQALLGMPLRVNRKSGAWLQVTTPDDYESWVLAQTVRQVTRTELAAWNTGGQVVVTALYAFVHERPDARAQTVSDVVAGDRLKLLGKRGTFFHVAYPDGRKGYLHVRNGQEIRAWRRTVKRNAASIIASAKRLIGLPYMWGGTSTKGVDCSGFVRTTLLMHDIVIPRDASQQAYKGEHLEIAPDFGNLMAGDLVFFGSRDEETGKPHVSHVGIYLGNKKFIHSLGFVHISSFNPQDKEYDEYDLNRLLWAQRVLPYINKVDGMSTTDRNAYYK